SDSFEREARIRMGLAEVEGFEGVERGVTGVIQLWKCVKKLKVRRKIAAGKEEEPTFSKPNPKR
ncbi:MAG: hypothetical protein ACYDHE_18135, partial [Candidatus Acidiferrales bacterium]